MLLCLSYGPTVLALECSEFQVATKKFSCEFGWLQQKGIELHERDTPMPI